MFLGVPKSDRLLAGVLFDAEGEPMTPTHAVKKGVRYRYYVSRRLITNARAKAQREQGQRLPADELERLVVERLKTFFTDADAITESLPPRRRSAPAVKRALAAAADIVKAIATEGDGKAFDLLRPLIARAQVQLDRIDVDLGADRVADAFLGGGSIEDRFGLKQDNERECAAAFSPGDDSGALIRFTVAAELKRAGMEMKFVQAGADQGSPDAALVRLLTRAHSLARHLASSPSSTLVARVIRTEDIAF